jgi:hypothetical protein
MSTIKHRAKIGKKKSLVMSSTHNPWMRINHGSDEADGITLWATWTIKEDNFLLRTWGEKCLKGDGIQVSKMHRFSRNIDSIPVEKNDFLCIVERDERMERMEE